MPEAAPRPSQSGNASSVAIDGPDAGSVCDVDGPVCPHRDPLGVDEGGVSGGSAVAAGGVAVGGVGEAAAPVASENLGKESA